MNSITGFCQQKGNDAAPTDELFRLYYAFIKLLEAIISKQYNSIWVHNSFEF